MSKIRLKINETIIRKYTGKKNPTQLQVLLLNRTETVFSIFLTSQETFSFLKDLERLWNRSGKDLDPEGFSKRSCKDLD